MINLNSTIFEILGVLFSNNHVNLHDIAREARLSVMGVSKIIKELEAGKIVTITKIGRSHMVRINPVKNNIEVFSLAEKYRFERFIRKHVKLKPFLLMAKEQVDADFVLIFGSYASGEESAGSDLDVLIVSDKEDIKAVNSIKPLLDVELSPVFVTKKNFITELRKKHRLYTEILNGKKVLVNGEYNFWNMVVGL